MSNIKIFDTTLRDGEQSPGATMTLKEKIRIARMLEDMRIDIIEAGFPAASKGDFEAVKAVSSNVSKCTICALSRAHKNDIKLAGEALKTANNSRIHTFIATSEIHMKYKLKMDREQVIKKAVEAVKYARNFTDDIEFSAEDAMRSKPEFLVEVFRAVIDAGATTINIPDTVGYAIPQEMHEMIEFLKSKLKNDITISVHCHNDLGMATANSLSAVLAGASQVECTINGIGERAGNASLEEIVMAIKTRKDKFQAETNIDTTKIVPASKLVSSITGLAVQANKAIVGINAFSHEAGIHQDGVIKKRETYEIMKAQDVGWQDNRMVLGKHSGRNALKTRLEEIGIKITSEDVLDKLFKEFKNLADKKHEIFDDDLMLLATKENSKDNFDSYKLKNIEITMNTENNLHKAEISIIVNNKIIKGDSIGNGVIDAVFNTIKNITKTNYRLADYSVKSVTPGTDAQGEVIVKLTDGKKYVNGKSANVDIIIASAEAYIDAINKITKLLEFDKVNKTSI